MRSNASATGDDIVLVDMLNLAHRMHYAHIHLSSGESKTGVTYGVLKTLRDLRENVSKRVVFAWDHGISVLGAPKPRNWRDAMMDGYKAARKPNDAYADIIPQLAPLHKILCTLGYSHVSVMGLEADDVIGVLAKSAWPGSVKLILSTDRDFYQLLDEAWVHVLVPKKDKGAFKFVYQSDVEREHGISVNRWAEYLALGGDKSDSIKPMKGMGPKTAIKLIQSDVDLSKLLEHQPIEFRNKYCEVWKTIQKCYSAARIPTRWDDPRIKANLDAAGYSPYTFATLSPDQTWKDADMKARALREFTVFLADLGMTSLLAEAKSFFDTESKPKCYEQRTSTTDTQTSRRHVFAGPRPAARKRLL